MLTAAHRPEPGSRLDPGVQADKQLALLDYFTVSMDHMAVELLSEMAVPSLVLSTSCSTLWLWHLQLAPPSVAQRKANQ